MEKRDLSVIITARNEEFLSRTVDGVLENKRGNTDVIVVMDGGWAEPPLKDHPDVTIIYHKESVGQRAAINEAARISNAELIMKLDAHCIVSEGFDLALIEAAKKLGDKVTQVPTMYNLHAFDWECRKCGKTWYQSPTPKTCRINDGRDKNPDCDNTPDDKGFERVIVWKPRLNRKSEFYRFDKDLKFQYWGALKRRPESQGDYVETMSLLGACFVMNRKRYFDLGGSDEKHGSWGQQGTEIACMTWLSGGRLITNRRCWFAHMFRTQGGDFGFPYPLKGSDVRQARSHSRSKWTGQWKHAKHDLDWLVNKFAPVPGWHDGINQDSQAGVLYYTDNQLKTKIARRVQKQILDSAVTMPIVSVSLKKMEFPYKQGENIHIERQRGWETMNRQILAGLKKLKTKYVFFCEHDVLYPQSHFDFIPNKDDVYYYNTNVWKLRATDGLAVKVDDCRQLSGMVCNRELAIKHYTKRLKMIEVGIPIRRIGFEPGTHNRKERVDDLKSEVYQSAQPLVDIRTGKNATASRWSPDQFRNKKYTEGWTESYDIPYWGSTKELITNIS